MASIATFHRRSTFAIFPLFTATKQGKHYMYVRNSSYARPELGHIIVYSIDCVKVATNGCSHDNKCKNIWLCFRLVSTPF